MSDYLRPARTGATIFFTVRLAHRGAALLLDHLDLLRAAVHETLAAAPVRIDAFVVLPDHLHAVWTLPPGDRAYGRRWGAIKARFTRAVGRVSPQPCELPVVRSGRYAGLKPGLRVDKREKAVWQRLFWEHHVRGPEEFAACVRYCWYDPVKHGYVAHPADWAASSIHRDIREGRVEPEWLT
ncbi:hypothetical protein OG2516_13881, partial [Oceanicola granulosus HTCC2516]